MSDEPTVEVHANKADWLAARLTGIGSSDAAAVVGLRPFGKSALHLYAEKLGLAEADLAETEAMEWGLLLEPAIATKYERETGRPLRDPGRFTLVRSGARPFMLATPDREVLTPNTPWGCLGLLEIKTAGFFRADEWADEPPLQYQVQLQHQLAVMGCAWGSLAVLIGGQRFLWVDMPRNDRFIALLIEREEEFWARIETLDPPPPDADSNELMATLWPTDTGTTVPLPPEALGWDRARAEAMAAMDRQKAVKDEAEALLKAALKDATYGILPGGAGRYSWKEQDRAGYTVDPWHGRVLRRLKK